MSSHRTVSTARRRLLQGVAGAAVTVPVFSGCTPSTRSRALPQIKNVKGPVLTRGSAGYERWRQSLIWQMRKPDRFPELIVRPRDTAEVAATVRFASARGMQVAVKSGGHSVWTTFLRDSGLLIDLSEFRHFEMRAGAGRARVGPALWARDLTAGLAPARQGFPVAHCATVPLGGYLTGGGLGLNGDAWGAIACFSVLGARTVTADGDIVDVNESTDSDLLWALRGGAARFPGIVCDFDLQTHDRSIGLYSSTFAFPMAALDEALQMLRAIQESEPQQTELLALMLHAPGAPLAVGDPNSKVIVIRAQVYVDDEDQAKRTLAPMLKHPTTRDSGFSMPLQPETYKGLFVDSMDWRRGFGFGRFAVDNAWTDRRDETIHTIAKTFVNAPSWKSHVVIQPKLSTLPAGDAGAFSRMASTYVAAYGVWDEELADDANLAWIESMGTALGANATGQFINEVHTNGRKERTRLCYSPTAWQRLAVVKKRYDPNGVFFDFPSA